MLSLIANSEFDAEVICPEGALSSCLREQDIPVHPIQFAHYAFSQNPLWHLWLLCALIIVIRKCDARVIVLNLDGNVPVVTLAALFAGIPLIRFCRFEFTAPGRLDAWCWRRTNAIICPSKTVCDQFLTWAGADSSQKTYALYDPCEFGERNTGVYSNHHEPDRNSKVIGFVGRVDRVKKIEIAIDVLSAIRREGVNANLLVVGGGDGSPESEAYLEELEGRVRDRNITRFVQFTGPLPHPEVGAHLATFDVLILPSDSESFGLALVEAWSWSVPTVASDTGGCREITSASGGGFLATTGDVADFSGKVLHLLEQPVLSQKMGAQGSSWVENNCNPIRYAQKFNGILNQVTNP